MGNTLWQFSLFVEYTLFYLLPSAFSAFFLKTNSAVSHPNENRYSFFRTFNIPTFDLCCNQIIGELR